LAKVKLSRGQSSLTAASDTFPADCRDCVASRKIRFIDWLGELPWIIFFGILTLIMWSVIASILAQTLAGVFPALEVPVAHFVDWAVGIQKQYLAPTLDFSFGFFLVFCFVIALVISVASMSMILLGGIRISIFESIGVLDQARSQAELFKAAVGAVVVSMMPEGDAQTLMVNGRSFFNHTTICNDLRVQERIAIFMREQITAAAGNTTALGVPETASPFILSHKRKRRITGWPAKGAGDTRHQVS
jgi:hypothetical protein